MNTIYSLPEYKWLNKCIKHYFPKHIPAIWWMHTANSLQLVAAPSYKGYKSCVEMPYSKDSQVYSFSQGVFCWDDYLSDMCPDIGMFCKGLQYSGVNDRLLYLHSDIFKYNIELFKTLFERVATQWSEMDTKVIRFKRHGIYKDDESPFISEYDKFAFYTLPKDEYTFEKFVMLNDFNELKN